MQLLLENSILSAISLLLYRLFNYQISAYIGSNTVHDWAVRRIKCYYVILRDAVATEDAVKLSHRILTTDKFQVTRTIFTDNVIYKYFKSFTPFRFVRVSISKYSMHRVS